MGQSKALPASNLLKSVLYTGCCISYYRTGQGSFSTQLQSHGWGKPYVVFQSKVSSVNFTVRLFIATVPIKANIQVSFRMHLYDRFYHLRRFAFHPKIYTERNQLSVSPLCSRNVLATVCFTLCNQNVKFSRILLKIF